MSRAMRPLIVVNFLLLFGFLHYKYSYSLAEYKTFNLRKIFQKFNSLAITEGMFNDIGKLILRLKKNMEKTTGLEDVIIHENSANQVNRVVIKSKKEN